MSMPALPMLQKRVRPVLLVQGGAVRNAQDPLAQAEGDRREAWETRR